MHTLSMKIGSVVTAIGNVLLLVGYVFEVRALLVLALIVLTIGAIILCHEIFKECKKK